MTRNIQEFIGPYLTKGVFIPSMASAASAIHANEKDLKPALQLLFRDDIVSWYVSKSSQREGAMRSTQELERQLIDRVTKNVSLAQGRIKECVPNKSQEKDKKDEIDSATQRLFKLATAPENLSSMPLSYCSWL